MKKRSYALLLLMIFPGIVFSQHKAVEALLADSCMSGASVSISIVNASNKNIVFELNGTTNLIPASIQKLVTACSALELLGEDYSFTTRLGYTGSVDKKTSTLEGDIIIIGGGDPSLGSMYFKDYQGDFLNKWIKEIKDTGIRKINGRVITDDSRYDYQPVPPQWLWEDIGNYYGAGVYGLTIFDNSYDIHFKTNGEGSFPVIIKTEPGECMNDFSSMLTASGNTDKGYVFSAPYNTYTWAAGSIPVNNTDFTLRASITDPPLVTAMIVDRMLDSAGIKTSLDPTTTRIHGLKAGPGFRNIDSISSPPLKSILKVLVHESVNLYAEHLVKELGKIVLNSGTFSAGMEIIYRFLQDSGIDSRNIFLEDGSGLSPKNAINARFMTDLLFFMKNKSTKFNYFFQSLPEAGKTGTLKSSFKDPVFDSNLRAKSGSMTRVRSYAGYFQAKSGNEMAFCIIVNNFSGSHSKIVDAIGQILKETIIAN